MTTMAKIERLMGKAILDPDFRKLLLNDPDAAAKVINARLTVAQRVAIKNLNEEEVEWWAQGFQALKSDDEGFLW